MENTKEEHLEMSVQALDRLATKTARWILEAASSTQDTQ